MATIRDLTTGDMSGVAAVASDDIESGVTIGEGAILADGAAVANNTEPRDEVIRKSDEVPQEAGVEGVGRINENCRGRGRTQPRRFF